MGKKKRRNGRRAYSDGDSPEDSFKNPESHKIAVFKRIIDPSFGKNFMVSDFDLKSESALNNCDEESLGETTVRFYKTLVSKIDLPSRPKKDVAEKLFTQTTVTNLNAQRDTLRDVTAQPKLDDIAVSSTSDETSLDSAATKLLQNIIRFSRCYKTLIVQSSRHQQSGVSEYEPGKQQEHGFTTADLSEIFSELLSISSSSADQKKSCLEFQTQSWYIAETPAEKDLSVCPTEISTSQNVSDVQSEMSPLKGKNESLEVKIEKSPSEHRDEIRLSYIQQDAAASEVDQESKKPSEISPSGYETLSQSEEPDQITAIEIGDQEPKSETEISLSEFEKERSLDTYTEGLQSYAQTEEGFLGRPSDMLIPDRAEAYHSTVSTEVHFSGTETEERGSEKQIPEYFSDSGMTELSEAQTESLEFCAEILTAQTDVSEGKMEEDTSEILCLTEPRIQESSLLEIHVESQNPENFEVLIDPSEGKTVEDSPETQCHIGTGIQESSLSEIHTETGKAEILVSQIDSFEDKTVEDSPTEIQGSSLSEIHTETRKAESLGAQPDTFEAKTVEAPSETRCNIETGIQESSSSEIHNEIGKAEILGAQIGISEGKTEDISKTLCRIETGIQENSLLEIHIETRKTGTDLSEKTVSVCFSNIRSEITIVENEEDIPKGQGDDFHPEIGKIQGGLGEVGSESEITESEKSAVSNKESASDASAEGRHSELRMNEFFCKVQATEIESEIHKTQTGPSETKVEGGTDENKTRIKDLVTYQLIQEIVSPEVTEIKGTFPEIRPEIAEDQTGPSESPVRERASDTRSEIYEVRSEGTSGVQTKGTLPVQVETDPFASIPTSSQEIDREDVETDLYSQEALKKSSVSSDQESGPERLQDPCDSPGNNSARVAGNELQVEHSDDSGAETPAYNAGDKICEFEAFVYVPNTDHVQIRCNYCFQKLDVQRKECSACSYAYYCNRHCQNKHLEVHRKECPYLCRAGNSKKPGMGIRLVAHAVWKLEISCLPRPTGRKQLDVWINPIKETFKNRVDPSSHEIFCTVGNKRYYYSDLPNHRDCVVPNPSNLKAEAVIKKQHEIFRSFVHDSSISLEYFSILYGKVRRHMATISDGLEDIGIGMYFGMAAIQHSCFPNANMTFIGTRARIVASFDIPVADPHVATIRLFEDMAPRDVRRAKLKNRTGEICNCIQCRDDQFEGKVTEVIGEFSPTLLQAVLNTAAKVEQKDQEYDRLDLTIAAETLTWMNDIVGNLHYARGIMLQFAANGCMAQQLHAKAAAYLLHLLPIQRNCFGPNSRQVLRTLLNISRLRYEIGEVSIARDFLSECLQVAYNVYGRDNPYFNRIRFDFIKMEKRNWETDSNSDSFMY